ncbi:TetR/AcrR family transcriptional regulator [Saccharothrix deserti]|uniref:TetR/AcrR family transcriptional regulator n=1 Tax=Saccharothrix deserti TaxID=2593674 RepID=UPI00131E6627|nr:TetR/AcrR family transcriptional regulator [Saccharothrix deserti]
MSREGRRRADAERNIEAILDAALECFSEQPDASMTSIAQAAGVSRVTLYTHFPSREDLLGQVLDRAVSNAAVVLDAEALDEGTAVEALSRLIRSAWHILAGYRNLMTAASAVLSPRQVRGYHKVVLQRVERLIARGRDEGSFRTDLPQPWLVTVFYSLIHVAADEVGAGRLKQRDAADVLEATVLGALMSPATIGR